jgi:hypothetical protein
MSSDPRKETAELSTGARRDAILQDLRHDWVDSPERSPTINFVERCFVATTVAGFIGLLVVLIWMWPT